MARPQINHLNSSANGPGLCATECLSNESMCIFKHSILAGVAWRADWRLATDSVVRTYISFSCNKHKSHSTFTSIYLPNVSLPKRRLPESQYKCSMDEMDECIDSIVLNWLAAAGGGRSASPHILAIFKPYQIFIYMFDMAFLACHFRERKTFFRPKECRSKSSPNRMVKLRQLASSMAIFAFLLTH